MAGFYRILAFLPIAIITDFGETLPVELKKGEMTMPKLLSSASRVSEVEAAHPSDVIRHFERLLTFETDCWDVYEAMKNANHDFVLLDVRSPQMFQTGHIPGAVNLPHGRINERNLGTYASDTLFVVYCGGPHCNGADRAAVNLARIGRKAKKMIGGIEGWKDEGFDLARG
jgi:rhodanese-related sulfurtransferase